MPRYFTFSRLLSICLVFSFLLAACDDLELVTEEAASPPTRVPPTRAPTSNAPRPTVDPNDKRPAWLVMLYFDADDETLEQDILTDFNEAERVGSTGQVQIVAQVDRYDGGYDGMEDWTTAKRFFITQDDDLESIGSKELDDLGEVAMSDEQTLIDFITWAAKNYPAQHYALVMSDHGAGWTGGWFDPAPGGIGADNIYLAKNVFGGDALWLMELDRALDAARAQAGIHKFDVIALDVCLMGQAEVFTMLAQHADYAVASEEVVPSVGLAYTDWVGQLTSDPTLTGEGVAQAMVKGFIDSDQTVTDDEYRARHLADYGRKDVGARAYARALGTSVTMAAVDLSAMDDLHTALNAYAAVLAQTDAKLIGKARSYAQSYEPVFGAKDPSAFIDLGNFAEQLLELSGNDRELAAVTQDLQAAIVRAVIAEKHGKERSGSNGIAIYFPVAKQYKIGDDFGYVQVADRFASVTDWDEFLASYYGGVAFQPGGAASAPIALEPIQLSATTASAQKPVRFTSKMTGDRIAYIYYFLGRYLADENKMIVEDIDYIASDQTAEADGVYYPVWPTTGVALDEEWDATVFGIDDGQNVVPALISPEAFGPQDASALYAVIGEYRFANGNKKPRFAKLLFTDEGLEKVLVYAGNDTSGAPREVNPKKGDQFIIYETLINLETGEYEYREGGTVTFGKTRLKYTRLPAASGAYSIGFFAEDLDGDLYQAYADVSVK